MPCGNDREVARAAGAEVIKVPSPGKGRAVRRLFEMCSDEVVIMVDGDATYDADYDLDNNQVLLRMVKGSRKEPPPIAYLPKFPGLKICVEGPRGIAVVRERG